MTNQRKQKLVKAVANLWGGEEPRVEVNEYSTYIEVTASRMYDYLPLDWGRLLKLRKLFKADFDIDKQSAKGCETCDYGSSYAHVFTIKKK